MFLVCPKCFAAKSKVASDGPYRCHACGHRWAAPHHVLSPAYFASLGELTLGLVSGHPNPERFDLPSLPAVIGRDSECRALQANLAVSRRHCELHCPPDGDAFEVRDLGGSGGTAINAMPIGRGGRGAVAPGDDLVLAGTPLRVEARLRRDAPSTPAGDVGLDQPAVPLVGVRSLSFIDVDVGGRLGLCERPEGLTRVVGALCPCGSGRGFTLFVLRRDAVRVNGEIAIEHDLMPGDQVWIAGGYYTFNPATMELHPEVPPGGPELAVRGVRVAYHGRRVLNGVTCAIPGAGKLTAILGPSGSGKSTLLKVLSGLRAADAGDIRAVGSASPYAEWARRHVALVPQHDVVHGELSVGRCLTYAAQLDAGDERHGMATRDRVRKVLQDTLLDGMEGHRVDELSGGQRKRVNVAAALTGSPDLLLLDEPTSGLDSSTEAAVVAVLRRLARQGRTVVFATHSQAAVDAADHVVVLSIGKDGTEVAAEGSPAEVKSTMRSNDWSEVFDRIALKPGGDPGLSQNAGPCASALGANLRMPAFVTLSRRYAEVWQSNPVTSAAMLLGLPLLLGLIIRLAVSNDSPLGTDRLLFGVVAAFWLGMNQTVREIVKERAIFLQEQMRRAACLPYLVSKLLFFAVIAVPQAVLLMIPLKWISVAGRLPAFELGEIACPWHVLTAGLWLGVALGSCLGLLISVACLFLRQKGEVAAVMLVILVTLPQLLFSEKVLPQGLGREPANHYTFERAYKSGEAGELPELLSYFTFSRYLFLPLDRLSEVAVAQPERGQGRTARTWQDYTVRHAFVFNWTILAAAGMVIVVLSWIGLESYVAYQRRRL